MLEEICLQLMLLLETPNIVRTLRILLNQKLDAGKQVIVTTKNHSESDSTGIISWGVPDFLLLVGILLFL